MKTSTGLIVLTVELTTAMEGRINKLNGWDSGFFVNIDRDTTTFVFDG